MAYVILCHKETKMKAETVKKYRPFQVVDLPDRTWPSRRIEKAPVWCSVDLRDGNHALILPMTLDEKLELFQLLVDIGFKQIEVGFPSAAKVEYDFLRALVDQRLIPDDVTVQVLTQAREHLVTKTFEALDGCDKAILHIYNSTSVLQREIVFEKSKDEIKRIAVDGVELVKKLTEQTRTKITLEYSPESFTGTEIDYAIEVCDEVLQAWQPTPEHKAIINLPATVEMYTPNIYADQIEYFSRQAKFRDSFLLSLHAHNDRGTAVAATELALMGGGDRVEGTLFGNGERTGNVDIITLALNMHTQGVDPGLNLHDIDRIIKLSEKVTKIPVHVRQPYAGELVYTAFSGSHQDAINKGMKSLEAGSSTEWSVPYLPIDPTDLGRSYEQIIRINSQSGKGGVAYVMKNEFGCNLPKAMHPELGRAVQRVADKSGKEIMPEDIWAVFESDFLKLEVPLRLENFSTQTDTEGRVECSLKCEYNAKALNSNGRGNGPIDACKDALINLEIPEFSIKHYSEHALDKGSDSKAIAYIQIMNDQEKSFFGVGIDENINRASIKALFSAINRSERAKLPLN